jgi:hypothetical protein
MTAAEELMSAPLKSARVMELAFKATVPVSVWIKTSELDWGVGYRSLEGEEGASIRYGLGDSAGISFGRTSTI